MGSPFRALHIPAGTDKDAHGRGIGSDWRVVSFGTDDGGAHNEVTTDCVHASDFGALVPGTERGIARLLAVALNEAFGRRTWAEWSDLLTECAEGEPPPEPQAPVICAVCGKEGANAATCAAFTGGTFVRHHTTCRLPGDDDLPF